MAQAHREQPWGKQGEEGMARSRLHCSWSREDWGWAWGSKEVVWWWSRWEEELEEGWGRGKNNSNSQYLLHSLCRILC